MCSRLIGVLFSFPNVPPQPSRLRPVSADAGSLLSQPINKDSYTRTLELVHVYHSISIPTPFYFIRPYAAKSQLQSVKVFQLFLKYMKIIQMVRSGLQVSRDWRYKLLW